ncbi:DUF882 domain-containing protein [Methyloceanibacter sp.]|uniref:DUF882 domain-containing protein n=1 Tax=Methyloceanibacter sp. TaxID=1965321 RepID=UPI003D6D4696
MTLVGTWFWPATVQHASASGETRTLSMFNIHTKEAITVTFKKDGRYDPDALKQLDHFMRDWRKEQSRDMDPELIDLIWTLHRELGSKEPVKLICGYRTASTNERLRRRGGGQAKASQHILGKAADIVFPDVPVKTLRNSALVQEWGGVGYYPTSGVPFVHVDTGRVRMWPRIARLELAALFPSGRTNYLPLDGKPITQQDYKLAMAKGLPGRNTLLASVMPAPKPEAVAAAQPAIQPAVQPIIQAAFHPEVAFHPEAAFRSESALRAEPEPPQGIFASYVPDAPSAAPAVTSPPASQAAPLPTRKHFVYANAGGELPQSRPVLGEPSSPLYRSAEVVSAPEVDEDHPEETSYVPFAIAGLMSNTSITYNHLVAHLTHPEQKDLSYLFENMDRPLAATFRKSSGYQGLVAAQTFSGRAVRSVYAEIAPPAPTRVAQIDR